MMFMNETGKISINLFLFEEKQKDSSINSRYLLLFSRIRFLTGQATEKYQKLLIAAPKFINVLYDVIDRIKDPNAHLIV